jgi:hypothetical protein
LKAATAITKTTAFEYLSTHSHPAEPMEVNGEAVLSHNCGRAFLNCIANHALHIDALRAEIDDNYKRMKTYKLILLKPLGLESVKERIPDCYRSMPGRPATATHPDPYNQDLIGKFFRILDLTLKLKEIRREIYRKIAAVKKCWFGWLSTQEAKLALRLNAAVVREDTDFIAIPNDDPKYRGRTFNRLLNNGSRGQYERAASHKLAWLGIPEVRIPSFYTSMADVRKAVIEAFRRKGEVFTDVDGVVWHADEHAALTIAVWLLLRPLSIAMTGGASTSAIPA